MQTRQAALTRWSSRLASCFCTSSDSPNPSHSTAASTANAPPPPPVGARGRCLPRASVLSGEAVSRGTHTAGGLAAAAPAGVPASAPTAHRGAPAPGAVPASAAAAATAVGTGANGPHRFRLPCCCTSGCYARASPPAGPCRCRPAGLRLQLRPRCIDLRSLSHSLSTSRSLSLSPSLPHPRPLCLSPDKVPASSRSQGLSVSLAPSRLLSRLQLRLLSLTLSLSLTGLLLLLRVRPWSADLPPSLLALLLLAWCTRPSAAVQG